MNLTMKRITLYVLGLFVLAFGVSFSILAGFGVSPVSSLPVAVALSSGLSVGVTTVITNLLFIFLHSLLYKRMNVKDIAAPLIVAFLFGFFTDITLFLLKLFPTPETIVARSTYLLVSLFAISAGLLGYMTAKLPLMPYDALTYAIYERLKMKFSKAKILLDSLNVSLAGAICLIFIQSLGSIGIGTLIAAYLIGKILGWMLTRFKPFLLSWLHTTETNPNTKEGKSVQ